MKQSRFLNKVLGFIKYLIYVITLLFAVSIISFVLVSLSPVDPVTQYVLGSGNVSSEQRAEIEKHWGLNEPPVKRYTNWLGNFLKGDMGESLLYRQPVKKIITERFSNTFALMMVSWFLSGTIGFSLGCVMGINQNKFIDSFFKKICLILSSLPTYWVGLLFLIIFSVSLNWFPIGFSSPIGSLNEDVTFFEKLHHLILPAVTLSFTSFASIALHTREKLLEVLNSEYVLFSKARGYSNINILKKHGIRNILLPAITLQFASFAELFGGSVLAENVFSYPGLGSAVAAAGLNSDVPLLLGVTLASTLFVYVGNLIANLIYTAVDPRIKEGGIFLE